MMSMDKHFACDILMGLLESFYVGDVADDELVQYVNAAAELVGSDEPGFRTASNVVEKLGNELFFSLDGTSFRLWDAKATMYREYTFAAALTEVLCCAKRVITLAKAGMKERGEKGPVAGTAALLRLHDTASDGSPMPRTPSTALTAAWTKEISALSVEKFGANCSRAQTAEMLGTVSFTDAHLSLSRERGRLQFDLLEYTDNAPPSLLRLPIPFDSDELPDDPEVLEAKALLDECVAGWFGSTDSEEWQVVQEFMAACVMGEATRMGRILVLKGGPGTGKSTLVSILKSLFPEELTVSADPSRWGSRFGPTMLDGRALATCSEVPSDLRSSASILKALVLGEEVDCEVKYQSQRRQLRSRCGFAWATNHDLNFGHDRDPMLDRLITINMERPFRNTDLEQKDLPERIAPYRDYFIRQVLKIGRSAIEAGRYSLSTNLNAATEEMLSSGCSVKEWLEHESAAPSNDRADRIRTTHAYARYEEWAKGRAIKRAEFYRRMGSYGYNRGLSDGYSVYKISFYTDGGDSFAVAKEQA